jgi:diguanylate cyclase (GGDEF)-like protein
MFEKPESPRERIADLQRKDNSYDDSAYDIAKAEDAYREKLSKAGVSKKDANDLADNFSDEVLNRIEATKEKWTDNLTGLRNKNAYIEEAPQMLSMEKRQKNDSSFLVIDFDHFREVNNNFGHLAGDEALQKIAAIIKKEARNSDIVYRFGGEEFMVFLPDTPSSLAKSLAERIRAAVENAVIEVTNEKGQEVELKRTISIGCIGTDQLEEWKTYKDSDAKKFLEKMIKFADAAVYESKNSGRNRVTLYEKDSENNHEENELGKAA